MSTHEKLAYEQVIIKSFIVLVNKPAGSLDIVVNVESLFIR